MDFSLGKKSPAKETRVNSEMKVNSISEFNDDILVPLGPKWIEGKWSWGVNFDFSLHLRHFNRVAIEMERHRLGVNYISELNYDILVTLRPKWVETCVVVE